VSFINELKRRNVFKVGVAYIVVAWLLAQVADLMVDNFGAPDWVMKSFLGFLVIGFPLAIFFAWAFELTPEGVKREKDVDRSQSITAQTGQKLNYAIMVVMALALAWFAWDRFGGAPETSAPAATTTVAQDEPAAAPATNVKSLAVLPFIAMSSGADDEYFADGLTEEILNSLAQLPELLITARTSSFHFKGQEIPVQEIAATLGVKNIVEGSVRRSGDRLRVTAQLIRAADGFHLWSENYDSISSDTIQVQEDIAEKIAEAMDVVLDDDKRDAMHKAGLRNVEAFVDYQKAQELYADAHGEADQIAYLRRANEQLEKVIELVPNYPPAYIDHTDLYVHMLMDDAIGQKHEDVTPQDLEEAPQKIKADLSAAAENARNFAERNDIEFDLAFLSGDWRGFQGYIERFLSEDGCNQATWAPGIIAVSGLAASYTQRARQVRKCDPMHSHAWFDESRAFLWAGDPEEALKVAREGLQVAPPGWLPIALARALVANGLFEEVDNAVATQFRVPEDGLMSQVLKSAAMGNREAAVAFFEQLTQQPDFNEFFKSIYLAWIGDRENANRRAAQIDTQPFGSQSLLLLAYWCACGAPFDLEVAPNYAQRVKAAGMPWPPASPIKFPLKDW
jgi:TolB-like protein